MGISPQHEGGDTPGPGKVNMANGEIVREIRTLLDDKNAHVSARVRDRLILGAIAELYDRLDTFQPMYFFYKVALWVGSAIGLGIIGLVILLASGQAQIVVK